MEMNSSSSRKWGRAHIWFDFFEHLINLFRLTADRLFFDFFSTTGSQSTQGSQDTASKDIGSQGMGSQGIGSQDMFLQLPSD